MIISAFPGTGKSYFTANYQVSLKQQLCWAGPYADDLELETEEDWSVCTLLDSDSSKFSWVKPGERDPKFPYNYLEYIKKSQRDNINCIQFVSTHQEVRDALELFDMRYTVIVPDLRCKDEYIWRFKARGNDDKFIAFIGDNWEDLVSTCRPSRPDQNSLYILKKGEYISDLFKRSLKFKLEKK